MNTFHTYLALLLLSAVCAEGSVAISNPAAVPEKNAAVSQLKTGGVILQSRYTKSTDWKGIGQSFKWNTEEALDGIGLFISQEQAVASPPYSKDLPHVLIIQELEGYRGAPGKTVYQVEFILKAENVKPGQWLYLDIQDLTLKDHQNYGFTLVPAESALSSQRIYWATTDDASSYAGGDANQVDIPGRGLPPGNGIGFGSANRDAVFFLQSTANPEGGGVESVVESNEPPSAWIPSGNEKQIVGVKESRKSIIYLTAGESIDTHFHYHGETWGKINGRTYLFFSSSRERPSAAGKTVPGERQIMAADVHSGDLYYLTTIPNEGTGWMSHMNQRSYCATYNGKVKTIFFSNKNRTKVYAYNCISGVQKELFAMPGDGTSRELYSYADESSVRLIYTYSIPDNSGVCPPYPRSEYLAVADFDLGLNVITNRVVKQTKVGEALNHPEINPANKDIFFYQYKSGVKPNGSHAVIDFYLHNLADGTDRLIKTDGKRVDHQIWGASGETIYWDVNEYDDNLYAYEWKKDTLSSTSGGFYAGHNKLSSDERLWVYDSMAMGTHGSKPLFASKDEFGRNYDNWFGSIWIYNRETAQRTLYAIIIWGNPHPRHPHAVFSPDDSMISFVTAAAVSNENTRVAVMEVSE